MAAPAHLSEVAKRVWGQWEPILRKMGISQPDFAVALERACELYADVVALRQEIATNDRFYKTTNKAGDVMIRPHPAAGQLAETDRRLAQYLSELGLTPAGRAKLMAAKAGEEQDDGDEADSFFG